MTDSFTRPISEVKHPDDSTGHMGRRYEQQRLGLNEKSEQDLGLMQQG